MKCAVSYTPVIVPCTTDPFFSSIVTVSLFSFIKNLGTCMSVAISAEFKGSRQNKRKHVKLQHKNYDI